MKLWFMALIGLLLVLPSASPALGQGAQDVEGTADFRNPPMLQPGSYRDTIVTGETVWYAVVYTNNAPYRFEVSIDGEGADNEALDLGARFVGPTLGSVGDRATKLQGSARYSAGETNVWYLQVSLLTSGRLGVQYDLSIDVEGVSDARHEHCDELPDCTADEELAVVNAEVAALETRLADLPELVSDDEMQAEIDRVRSEIDTTNDEIDSANNAIARICGSETDCSVAPPPGSSTPLAGLIGGGLVLVGGLGFAGLQLVKRP